MNWEWLLGTPLMIACIVVVAIVIRWLIHRSIAKAVKAMAYRKPTASAASPRTARAAKVLRQAAGLDSKRREQRAETMGSVLRSVTTVVVFAIAALMVLSALSVPLGPLMASAGIGGVAIGFGAQTLVKDFLSGIFMIMEDQYGVGDVVDVGEATGTVEEVSLRVTRLRDATGIVWYVRNGEILRVGNRSQGWSTAMIDVPVAYDAPVDRVLAVLEDVVKGLDGSSPWKDVLLETPAVAGVQSVAGGEMTVRIMARCLPNENWALQREVLARAKTALDTAGIEGPARYL